METIQSAGIILTKKINGNIKILLGHTGSINPTNLKDKKWTIIKGRVEKQESFWEAAKREFFEEAGLKIDEKNIISIANYNGLPYPWDCYSLKSYKNDKLIKKTVNIYWIVDKTGFSNDFNFKCSTYFDNGILEIDDYYWATPKEALQMCSPSQRSVFRKIKKITENLKL